MGSFPLVHVKTHDNLDTKPSSLDFHILGAICKLSIQGTLIQRTLECPIVSAIVP